MYTALQVTSNFSFLRGASHPEELVQQAAALGYQAIALTDRNTLAGIVRAHTAALQAGIQFIPGCRIDLEDGPSLLAYPTDLAAYTRLSNLLTIGNLRAEKGVCQLYKADVYAHAAGLKLIMIPPPTLGVSQDFDDNFRTALKEYRNRFGTALYLAAIRHYNGEDSKYLFQLQAYAQRYDVPLVATNDVHYHHPTRRELQDVVTCVREKCTIQQAGFRLHPNAERYLKPPAEMERLFSRYPQALQHADEIAKACRFSLRELRYQYPTEVSEGEDPQTKLTQLAWTGAQEMYNNAIPDKVRDNLQRELHFIDQVQYAEYFLTVYDIVRYARSQGILCQGRGSAANSTVCYCLGITAVDPSKFDLLFERFISSARNEPPDIDVDFEHERREEVMQYIYQKYGRHRAAIVATVTQQHHRGALRDVGKAMGLSVDIIKRLSGLIWDFSTEGFDRERLRSQGIDPADPTVKKVLELTRAFIGFPRQLGQHTGGFVITRDGLANLCPVFHARMENRTCIEWNKDDIEALGFLKIDVLALGMLTCIRKAFDMVKQHDGRSLTLANIPQDDPKVYEMVSHADTIGVFQIESRAQQSMLPRLKPKCFYDLVIEVAIVRPGPIQGDMVHPYLRRRNGQEQVDYPSPELRAILERTLGVPLFQEQAMKIAIVAAGFTPAEADELRRSMATFKAKGKVSYFEQKLINGMISKGYSEEYARRVFRQLEGFGSYGFPESHAVSFALLVYVSSWLKCYYPEVFACALLNSMPMGFYQPSQVIQDAQHHGVTVLPPDILHSRWDNTLEAGTGRYKTLRLGYRQIKGLSAESLQPVLEAGVGEITSIQALRTLGLPPAVLEKLADADVFRSLGADRRQALWDVAASVKPEPLFGMQPTSADASAGSLPKMKLSEHVVQDYASMGLSVKAHPVQFVRESLTQLHVRTAESLLRTRHGTAVKVAGLVLVRQRPGTASGICFITLEDETGTMNLVVFEKLFNQYRKEIIQSRLLMVDGEVQREGEVIHVIVKRCYNATNLLRQLTPQDPVPTPYPTARADETTSPFIQGNIFPEGRNFR